MIDVPALVGFIAVVDAGTVRGAAERLGMSQAALSRRLQRLENDLKIRLFVRSGRRLRLSEAGTRLLPEVRLHLASLDQAYTRLKEEFVFERTTLTIGCLPTVAESILPPLFRQFTEAYPAVSVRLLDIPAPKIVDAVRDGAADFGVTSFMDSIEISSEFAGEDPLMLVVAEDHPLAQAEHVSWQDIRNERLIATGTLTENRQVLDNVRNSNQLAGWAHEVQRMSTAISYARAGIGHAILPRLAVTGPNMHGVRAVALRNPSIARKINVVRRTGDKLDSASNDLRRRIVVGIRNALAGPSRSWTGQATETPNETPGALSASKPRHR